MGGKLYEMGIRLSAIIEQLKILNKNLKNLQEAIDRMINIL